MYLPSQAHQQKHEKYHHQQQLQSKHQILSHQDSAHSATSYRPSSRASSVPAYSRDAPGQGSLNSQSYGYPKQSSCNSALSTIVTNIPNADPHIISNENQAVIRTIPIQRSDEHLSMKTPAKIDQNVNLMVKSVAKNRSSATPSPTIMQGKQLQLSPASSLQSKPAYQKCLPHEPTRSGNSEKMHSLPRTHLNSVMAFSLLPGNAKQTSISSETAVPRIGKKPAYTRVKSNTRAPDRFLQSEAETSFSMTDHNIGPIISDDRVKISENYESNLRPSPSRWVVQSGEQAGHKLSRQPPTTTKKKFS
ncbi:hypothetical protein FGIG_04122 [Fasciola gigantica]|uniref:Uncharacterized protein n=1 Tax=Fasciola gigantica TaxID=46835 RepID=A0A504YAF1_FASGI|nr:hypothetical protein FGIG_04122 [Fasciola gigantica]